MCLSRAVRTNEAHALTEVNLIREWLEQITDSDAFKFHNTTSGVGPRESNENLLIGNGWRRRSGLHELFPSRFSTICFCCVLEVLCSTLLHDLHVMEQTAFFIVPTLEVIAQKFLTLLTSFGECCIRTAMYPTTRTFNSDDFCGDSFEKDAIVAHHENGALAFADFIFEPCTRGDVEIVVRLVQEQHVRARVQEQVENKTFPFAA